MTSISDRILSRIQARGRGKWVCTPTDFLDLGDRAAIDLALSRLAAGGVLRRVSIGLYDLPRYSDTIKRDAPPDVRSAIDAIRRRSSATIVSDGMFHANKLKLTNAVPVNYSFYTDGATRDIKVGGWTVRLVHKGPKLMSWSGKPSGPVAFALDWLGPDASQDPRITQVLRRSLPDLIKKDLAGNLAILPNWARAIARDVVGGHVTHDRVGA